MWLEGSYDKSSCVIGSRCMLRKLLYGLKAVASLESCCVIGKHHGEDSCLIGSSYVVEGCDRMHD